MTEMYLSGKDMTEDAKKYSQSLNEIACEV